MRTRPAVAFPSNALRTGPILCSSRRFRFCATTRLFPTPSSFQLCNYAGHICLVNTAKMSGSEQIHDLTNETQDSQAMLESWRSKLVRIDTCECTVASGVRVPKIITRRGRQDQGIWSRYWIRGFADRFMFLVPRVDALRGRPGLWRRNTKRCGLERKPAGDCAE